MKNINSGDILITDNGNFMIINIACGEYTEEFFGWCAMYIDDEKKYPLEIQYIVSDDNLDLLIEQIKRDCKILKIKKTKRTFENY